MLGKTIPLTLLCVLCGCTESRINRQIANQFASGAAEIDLASVGPPDWERVCILGHYTNNERTEEVLGFQWDSEAHTSVLFSDYSVVLVFVRGNEVLAHAEHAQNEGDFSELGGQCLMRSNAVVVRRMRPQGWPYFVARDQQRDA